MPCSLKESFLCVPSFLPEFFVLIYLLCNKASCVFAQNAQDARNVRIALGDTPFFLHELSARNARFVFAHQKGFVSLSFKNMAHTAFWTLLGFLASLTQLEAMQKNTTLPHKTFVNSLYKRPNPIKPPGLRLQRVFLQAKREAALPPFLFLCCFYSASKVAVIASLFCTART